MTSPVVASSSIEARLSALECMVGLNQSGGIQKSSSSGIKNISNRLDALQTLFDSRTTTAFRETCSESNRILRDLDAGSALTYQQQSGSGSAAPFYYRRQEVLASADTLKQDMDQIQQMIPLLLVGSGHPAAAVSSLSSSQFQTGAQSSVAQKQQQKNQQQQQQQQQQQNKSKNESTGTISTTVIRRIASSSGMSNTSLSAASGPSSSLLREDQVTHAPIINSAHVSREDQRRLDIVQMDIQDLQKRTNQLSQRADHLLSCYQNVIAAISAKMVLADEQIAMITSSRDYE